MDAASRRGKHALCLGEPLHVVHHLTEMVYAERTRKAMVRVDLSILLEKGGGDITTSG